MPGFVHTVRTLFDEVAWQPGELLLDVGCGTEVMDRGLAEYTQRAQRIMAIDVNRYLLPEAKARVDNVALPDIIISRQNVVSMLMGTCNVGTFSSCSGSGHISGGDSPFSMAIARCSVGPSDPDTERERLESLLLSHDLIRLQLEELAGKVRDLGYNLDVSAANLDEIRVFLDRPVMVKC